VLAHATKVVGVAMSGHTVTVNILGVGFYGRPLIISSTGDATGLVVTHDSGTQLSVRVTVKSGTAAASSLSRSVPSTFRDTLMRRERWMVKLVHDRQ
jgi:hypothetical protein